MSLLIQIVINFLTKYLIFQNVLSPRKAIADVNDRDETIASLTKQLCDAESTILDQNDKIQILEQHLRESDTQNVVTEPSTCDETLHVKDQFIAKLEKDKKDMEMETAKLVRTSI